MEDKDDPVAKDLRATTDLEIDWQWESDGSLSVSSPQAAGNQWPAEDEGDWAWLADHLQDQYVIEQLGRSWPRCVVHGRHPMKAVMEGGTPLWVCPLETDNRVAMGSLYESQVPEPLVEDNRVRWYRDDWGVGVIAHSDGDIWFHVTSVEPKNAVVVEGQLVEADLAGGPHAGFRCQAVKVRLIK